MHRRLLALAISVCAIFSLTMATWAAMPGVPEPAPFAQKQPSLASGAPLSIEIWGADTVTAPLRQVVVVKDGATLTRPQFPPWITFYLRTAAPHTRALLYVFSSDGICSGWGPENVDPQKQPYNLLPSTLRTRPIVGQYVVKACVLQGERAVGNVVLNFSIVPAKTPPRNTHYFAGKSDSAGTPITCSAPVDLGRLNETPQLVDTDYPLAPQRANNVINFERFPPFHLPARFQLIWGTRRFTDEPLYGGPLDRGFTMLASRAPDLDSALYTSQRLWFDHPNALASHCQEWYKADPKKYLDLKGWADHRSAWVSPDNAYQLGYACYRDRGIDGYPGYNVGIYGWDEEEMWHTIGEKLFKEHPEYLPEELKALKAEDPDAAKESTRQAIERSYFAAWGEFLGNYYRGVKACAAESGKPLQIMHYGSLAPGLVFAGWVNPATCFDPATKTYSFERLDSVPSWYKKDGKLDFTANAYSCQMDFFTRDFYYQTIFPETTSIYERQNGQYVLDKEGRRKIRRDVFEEPVYGGPTKIGYEDCETSPAFLKSFIAVGENALFWLNGGAYYKQAGTLVAHQRLYPTLRPGNQETWGESAKLGSRPINPYLAEAEVVYTFMIGLEGFYLWDANSRVQPAGQIQPGETPQSLGQTEAMLKGLHRLSKFNALFDGTYAFIRPVRHHDMNNRDHPLIRGLVNGRYLLLAMTNPYLDLGETQQVEVWYNTPYPGKGRTWSSTVTLQPRRTHLFQCRLPALLKHAAYDPDKLYFRYTLRDGDYTRTFTVSGNYTAPYPYAE